MVKKTTEISESAIQASCFKTLVKNGYLVLRINSGSFGPSRRYKCSRWQFLNEPESSTGTSDILACSPTGQFVALELKRPGEKASKNQKKFGRLVKKLGGVFLIITSEKELVEELGLN